MIDPLMFIALLPAVVLVVYICRKDRTEKEPPALLAKLLGYGALSCLPAIVVELILSAVIERLNVRNVYLGYFLEAFVVAGLTEETCKFLFLRTTWRSPAFDYQFDAIVYAVMVALGFAAFENVKYVYSYGFATGIVRAVTAVPGHAIFGVFMGYFYGYAKLSDYWGRTEDRGAYLALSVVVLKALRKNRRYYYKTSHFATVSGLIYRMSRNAAGLASICILSTMVLVTVSTTVSLYKGLDAYADVRWPQDMTLTLMTDTRTNTVPDVAPVLQVVDDTMTRAGLTQSNVHGYRTVRFSALRSGDALDLTSKQLTGSSADEYAVMVLDTEGYADLTGEQVTLAPGEALAWTDGAAFGDTLTLGGDTLRLRQLDSFSLVSGSSIMGLHTLYLVVPDLDSVLELRAQQNAYASEHGGTRSMLNYTYQFDLSGTDDEQLDALHTLLSDPAFESAAEAANVNYTTDMRADGYPTLRSTYGGFLFLGFFLGFVFLFATVLIIYYKQVSEGYDDRGRFRIMQQVGMTPKEVKATIRTQVLLMFFLPLVTAAIHIAFAFPLIKQIVFAFGLQNVHLFLLCTLGTFGVFALLYTFVYLLTARTYYRIVRMTD